MLNNFLFDSKTLKFRCVQAYLHNLLKKAEQDEQNGKGEICVRNRSVVRENLHKICEIIEKEQNTFEDVDKASQYNPYLKSYYAGITPLVQKYFKPKETWTPGFLALEVLRLFTEQGYKTFEGIDFINLQAEYQNVDKEVRQKSYLPKHYACAEEIVKGIEKVKAFKKKRPSKRKVK